MEVKDYENIAIGLLVFFLGYQTASYGGYLAYAGDYSAIFITVIAYLELCVGMSYMCNKQDEITVD